MSKVILISEIGLCHNGSMETAKEMIRVSRECGATLVKGQGFNACDVKGSMPPKFYEDRQLSPMQLMELILYGREIGIEVFFSIFSKEYECLRGAQAWHKFSAGQSKKQPRTVEENDKFNVIASVNPNTLLPNLKTANVLYACPYLAKDPRLDYINFFSEYYGRQVGYSDHTVGIEWCLLAHRAHGAKIIEKHFTLTRDIYFEGKQFRDAIHSADPDQLAKLAGAL